MKKILMVFLMIGIGANVYAAKRPGGPGCSDVPVSWAFVDGYSVTSDGKGEYKHKADGVFNTVIHYDNCDGSRDATLGLFRSKRSVSIQIPTPINGSNIENPSPTFSGGASFVAKPFFNVRNLVGYPVVTTGVAATYYTKMSFGFEAPDRNDYNVAHLPDDFACPIGLTCVDSLTNEVGSANQNQPVQMAWVKVTYMPRDLTQDWSLNNTDKWLVEGLITDGTVRATLISNGQHFGQYHMPFQILITALARIP